jgi:hypothetical protein
MSFTSKSIMAIFNGIEKNVFKFFLLYFHKRSNEHHMKQHFVYLLFLVFVISCSTKKVYQSNHKNGYLRSDWSHWIDKDLNCLNTRAEILKARSEIPVKMNKKGCSVKKGRWKDYYYPEVHKKASQVDIDHLVPLKHAHDHGGAQWGLKEKEIFANDPDNLVITNRHYNRQKGSKSIDEWLPKDKSYACKYIFAWINLKKKYSLLFKEKEQRTIDLLKPECH